MNIQFLLLNNNMFNGDIPTNITNIRHLRHLNLAGNNISGAIPSYLSKLTAMTKEYLTEEEIDFRKYYLDPITKPFGEIFLVVMKRQELKYKSGFFDLVGIDLSQNHLTGEIPDQITSLNGLLNLNLSWNHLTGSIPEKIGGMKSMESLDLSRNYLSGKIPLSLPDLTYLSYMDLSYNNLTGQIPSGRQLDTLYTENSTIYDGNRGLCGPPIERKCPGDNSSESGSQVGAEKDYESIFFYLGFGSGFTVGLWVVFCALLFKRTWRIRYYRIFDRAYDKVFMFVAVTWGSLRQQSSAD